jgi:hypothetical protein
MRGRALLLPGLIFLLAGFSDETPIPEADITLRITTSATIVKPGEAFPLEVKRSWSKKLLPAEWSDDQLLPLRVRLVDVALRENGTHIEETLHYQCHAFSLDEILIPAPTFRAWPKDGGGERMAVAEDLRIRIEPALDPESPGPAELPCGMLDVPVPFPWLTWISGGAIAIALLGLLWYVQHRVRIRAALRAKSPPPPHVRALERLGRLRAGQPASAEEIDAFHVEASSLVREYIDERFDVQAPEMTTEQFLASPMTQRALEDAHCILLADFLNQCDRVKFGRHVPAKEDRERLLDSAQRFIEETRAEEALS